MKRNIPDWETIVTWVGVIILLSLIVLGGVLFFGSLQYERHETRITAVRHVGNSHGEFCRLEFASGETKDLDECGSFHEEDVVQIAVDGNGHVVEVSK